MDNFTLGFWAIKIMLIRDYLREIAELQKLSTEGYVSFTPIRVCVLF